SADTLTIEVGRSEAADPPADHDEIVGFIGPFGVTGGLPETSVAQRVRDVERTVVAAAHPSERRWIVAGRILREARRLDVPGQRAQARSDHRRAYAQRDAIQKIATRDRTIHPQFAIALLLSFVVLHSRCSSRWRT